MAELDRGQSGRDSGAAAVEGWITANGGGCDDRDAINEPWGPLGKFWSIGQKLKWSHMGKKNLHKHAPGLHSYVFQKHLQR